MTFGVKWIISRKFLGKWKHFASLYTVSYKIRHQEYFPGWKNTTQPSSYPAQLGAKRSEWPSLTVFSLSCIIFLSCKCQIYFLFEETFLICRKSRIGLETGCLNTAAIFVHYALITPWNVYYRRILTLKQYPELCGRLQKARINVYSKPVDCQWAQFTDINPKMNVFIMKNAYDFDETYIHGH